MLSKIKKSFLVFFLLLFTVISVATPYSYAQSRAQEGQGQWWLPTYSSFLDKVNQAPPNEIFGERYTHAQVAWIIHSLLNIIVGPVAACADSQDFGACMEAALNANADPGVLLPLAMMNDQFINTKPASSIDYVASKMERLGIVNEAYAQEVGDAGFGFANSLSIVQSFWTLSRDAAYSLVILMILILGFMVMFRAQLGAKTAVTIQSALPRVIIGLILITFSYALSGLLVDLTFVAQGIIAGIISASDLTTSALTPVLAFQNMNNVTGGIGSLFLSYIVAIFSLLFTGQYGDGTTGAVVGFLSGGGLVFAGISLIAMILIAIVALIALVRIFWIMLKTYVVVIMLVAVSPFIFLIGIVRDGMNMFWLKTMASHLSVFFSVGLMILFANILLFTSIQSNVFDTVVGAFEGLGFITIDPYFLREGAGNIANEQAILPGFTSFGSTATIGTFVSFGLFISIPNFAKSVKDYVAKGSATFSPETMGGAFAPGMAAGGLGYKAYDTVQGIRKAPERMAREARLGQIMKSDDPLAESDFANLAKKQKLSEAIKRLIK